MIKDQMTFDFPEVKTDQLLRLKEMISKYENLASGCRAQLSLECHHPDVYVVPGENYSEGGYDYVAKTIRYKHCTICGLIFDEKTFEHAGDYR